MKVRLHLRTSVFVVALLLIIPGILALAQDAEVRPGETVSVTATDQPQNVSLVIDEPQVVNIIVRGVEGTDPNFTLYNEQERSLSFVYDHETNLDLADTDAALENVFLPAGTYTLEITGFGGDGQAEVSIEPSAPGITGFGITETYTGEIATGGRLNQDVDFRQNEVVTIRVVAQSEEFDPRLTILNNNGQTVAQNDDYYSADNPDVALNFTDARVDLIVEAQDTYTLEITSYDPTDTGAVDIYVTRYGMIEPGDSAPEVIEDAVVEGGRRSFDLEVGAGQAVTITVRALSDELDPQVTLFDADGRILAENDDHRSNDPELDFLDARIANYIFQESGVYTIEVSSFSGEGDFELTIDRLGTFSPIEGAPGTDDSGEDEATPEATEAG
jgi:hypothetical protein